MCVCGKSVQRNVDLLLFSRRAPKSVRDELPRVEQTCPSVRQHTPERLRETVPCRHPSCLHLLHWGGWVMSARLAGGPVSWTDFSSSCTCQFNGIFTQRRSAVKIFLVGAAITEPELAKPLFVWVKELCFHSFFFFKIVLLKWHSDVPYFTRISTFSYIFLIILLVQLILQFSRLMSSKIINSVFPGGTWTCPHKLQVHLTIFGS